MLIPQSTSESATGPVRPSSLLAVVPVLELGKGQIHPTPLLPAYRNRMSAKHRALWENSVAQPAPATLRDGTGPKPRTDTKPSSVFTATARPVIIKGVLGAFSERNTALVTALKIIGAIESEYNWK